MTDDDSPVGFSNRRAPSPCVVESDVTIGLEASRRPVSPVYEHRDGEDPSERYPKTIRSVVLVRSRKVNQRQSLSSSYRHSVHRPLICAEWRVVLRGDMAVRGGDKGLLERYAED